MREVHLKIAAFKERYYLYFSSVFWILSLGILIFKVLVSLKILDENYRAKKHFKAQENYLIESGRKFSADSA